MATERINIVVTAVDNASRALTSVQTRLATLDRGLQRLVGNLGLGGRAGLVGGVGLLVAGMVKLADQFGRVEGSASPLGQAWERLNNALTQTVGSSDLAQGALNGLINAMDALGNFIKSPAFVDGLQFFFESFKQFGKDVSQVVTDLSSLKNFTGALQRTFTGVGEKRDLGDLSGIANGGVLEGFVNTPRKLGPPTELNNVLKQGFDFWQSEVKRAADATKTVISTIDGAFDGVGASFAQAARGAQKFGDVVLNVLNKLVDGFANLAVNKIFQMLFGNVGLGGFLVGGGSFNGGVTPGPNGFAGLYAKGGTIPAGKWGIAGESGPEAIIGPATVMPGGVGGGGTVVINQNVDARGSTMSPADLQAVLAAERAKTKDEVGRQMQRVLRGSYGVTPNAIPR